jgi:predicted DNA-binding transcriptional regulator AlpA
MTTTTNESRTGFYRLPRVLELIPVSKSTFWAGIKAGRYPAPVKLSSRISVWRAEEIFAFIAAPKGGK